MVASGLSRFYSTTVHHLALLLSGLQAKAVRSSKAVIGKVKAKDPVMPPASPTSHFTSHFRIFDLPLELREMIWIEALVPDQPFAYIFEWEYDQEKDDGRSEILQGTFKYPPLLQTCRQIRTEGTRIYFRRMCFCLRANDLFDPKVLRWMRSLDQDRAVCHIRNIDIDFHWPVDIRTLRGQLYSMERFLTWLDDNIPHHRFSHSNLWTSIPENWKGPPKNWGWGPNVDKLRKMLEDPEALALDGGRGVDLDMSMGRGPLIIPSDEHWTNA